MKNDSEVRPVKRWLQTDPMNSIANNLHPLWRFHAIFSELIFHKIPGFRGVLWFFKFFQGLAGNSVETFALFPFLKTIPTFYVNEQLQVLPKGREAKM